MDVGLKTRVPTKPVSFPLTARAAARVSILPRLIPAVLSGAVLWACYFPLAWGWLAWVALVPLLCLVRSPAQGWKTYLAAWIGGLVFFVPALQWMRAGDHPMEYAWILLAVYCALYFPAAIYLMRRLDRHTSLPLFVTVPLVWVALEWARSFMLTGFPWYYLAHSQHDFLPVIQISDITGAYGVSFLVAAFNAWVFELLYLSARFRDVFRLDDERAAPSASRHLWLQGAVILVVAAGTFFYGLWRLEQEAEFKPGPRIALLQSNLPQGERNRLLSEEEFVDCYYPLLRMAMLHSPRPDLVIWPETSFHWISSEIEAGKEQFFVHGNWYDVRPRDGVMPQVSPEWWRRAKSFRDDVGTLVKYFPRFHLLGLNSLVKDETGRDLFYNTALLVNPHGNVDAFYHKNHRVPFGEYVPLRDWLPFLDKLSPTEGTYGLQRGDSFTRFKLPANSRDGSDYHFGALICFEDTVPSLARKYPFAGKDGPPVDFLVNISNDGWFDGTSEHEEHLAVSRFRAIECRRALVRSVNMGISAVIDGNGRIHAPELVSQGPWKNWVVREQQVGGGVLEAGGAGGPPVSRIPDLPLSRWSEFKKVPGVVVATVPIDHRTSFYAIWGDWLPWACVLVLAAGCLWPVVVVRLRRGGTSPAPPHVGFKRVEPNSHGSP